MSQSRIDRMTHEVRIANYGRLAILTIAAAVVVVILSLTSMTSGEITAGETPAAPAQSESFVYFPSQYTNQATEASEHQQGF